MPLFLTELVPHDATRSGVTASRDALAAALADAGEIIESQVTSGAERVFVIVESADDRALATIAANGLVPVAEVTVPAPVRLVGTDLAVLKAARPGASHLVEWDLPAGLDMDTYLARKAAKTPLYDQVPEVAFLRTYVREDMVKCLCFYDAPDVEAVVRAREVVSAPVNRLHTLAAVRAAVNP